MTAGEFVFRRHAARLVALAIILGLYGLARQPELSGTEQARLAGRFRFVRQALPDLSGDLSRTVRPVHPSLKKIESWISTVGAAVALNDLDGDGLPNDVVYVDPRADRVIGTSRSRWAWCRSPTTPTRWPRWAASRAT
jgi:enediyne biosynthesis protein E4